MKTIGILFASALLFAGCKKKEEPAAGSASGSSAMGSGMGSAAGSDTGSAMGSAAGSGSDMGSAAAGSGSAMAGSGSAMAGSDTAMAGGGGIKDEADYESKRAAAMEEMNTMVEADKADCKKLATDMTAYVEKNQQLIKDAKAYEKAHADVKKKVDAKMKDKEKEQQKKMTPVMKTCMKDKDFMAAMKKMADMAK